jgi:hypothetical protein
MRLEPALHGAREHDAIHRERGAARHARLIRRPQNERSERAHLCLEQPVRVRGVGALEGVAAHELRERLGLVRRGLHDGTHLVYRHIMPALGQLPRGFRSREPAPDYDDARHTADSLCG